MILGRAAGGNLPRLEPVRGGESRDFIGFHRRRVVPRQIPFAVGQCAGSLPDGR